MSGGERHKFQIIDYTQSSEQAGTIQKSSVPADSENQEQLFSAGEKEQGLVCALCWHHLRRRETTAETQPWSKPSLAELTFKNNVILNVVQVPFEGCHLSRGKFCMKQQLNF